MRTIKKISIKQGKKESLKIIIPEILSEEMLSISKALDKNFSINNFRIVVKLDPNIAFLIKNNEKVKRKYLYSIINWDIDENIYYIENNNAKNQKHIVGQMSEKDYELVFDSLEEYLSKEKHSTIK